MAAIRFDNDWFHAHRQVLLGTWMRSDEAPGRTFRSVRAVQQGSAIFNGGSRHADHTEIMLARLPKRHEAAVRGHMQLYRSSLELTSLVPADALVQAAVQIEWLWYTTPFKKFYRDHLAHVMKVATVALRMWLDDNGPLSVAGRPRIEQTAEGLANGSLGSAALRAAARRLGNRDDVLRDPDFWKAVVLETTRLASLLHDLAYPSIMAAKVNKASLVADPIAPFTHDRHDAAAQVIPRMGGRLIAMPFHRGTLPVVSLARNDRQAFIDTLLDSHSLQAGVRILELARDADRLWRLTPMEAFIIEWAALAASLHDYDKLFELRNKPEDKRSPLAHWLLSSRDNVEAIRPCYQRDPVSYMVALADQLQDFGRLNYASGSSSHDSATLELRYPVSAVSLDADAQGHATIEIHLAQEARNQEREGIHKHKRDAERDIFGPSGWLDHQGLFEAMRVETTG